MDAKLTIIPKEDSKKPKDKRLTKTDLKRMRTKTLEKVSMRYRRLIEELRDELNLLQREIEKRVDYANGDNDSGRWLSVDTNTFTAMIQRRAYDRKLLSSIKGQQDIIEKELEFRHCKAELEELLAKAPMTRASSDFKRAMSWPKYLQEMNSMVRDCRTDNAFREEMKVSDNQFVFAFSPYYGTKTLSDELEYQNGLIKQIEKIHRSQSERRRDDYMKKAEEIKKLVAKIDESKAKCREVCKRQSPEACDYDVVAEQLIRLERHIKFIYKDGIIPQLKEIRYIDGVIYILVDRVEMHDAKFVLKQMISMCSNLYLKEEFAFPLLDGVMPFGYLLFDAEKDKALRLEMKDKYLEGSPTFCRLVYRVSAEIDVIEKKRKANGIFDWWSPVDIDNMAKYEKLKSSKRWKSMMIHEY